MSKSFDPYDQWLGIPAAQQPANHYRLFGLPLFEGDLEVIANVTQQVMARVREFQIGPRSEYSQRLLNELAAARVCLKDTERKAKYDAELRTQLEPPKLPPTGQTQPAVNKPVERPAAASAPPTPPGAPAVPAQSAISGTNTPPFGLPRPPAFNWRKRVFKPQLMWILAAACMTALALVAAVIVGIPLMKSSGDGGGSTSVATMQDAPIKTPQPLKVSPKRSKTEKQDQTNNASITQAARRAPDSTSSTSESSPPIVVLTYNGPIRLVKLQSRIRYLNNRLYEFGELPAELNGLVFTELTGGKPQPITMRAPAGATVYVFTDPRDLPEYGDTQGLHELLGRSGWTEKANVPSRERHMKHMRVFGKTFENPTTVTLPAAGFTGVSIASGWLELE